MWAIRDKKEVGGELRERIYGKNVEEKRVVRRS